MSIKCIPLIDDLSLMDVTVEENKNGQKKITLEEDCVLPTEEQNMKQVQSGTVMCSLTLNKIVLKI